MRPGRNLVLLAAVLLGSGGLYLAVHGLFRDLVPEMKTGLDDLQADLSVEGIELRQGRDGRMLWRLRAPRGEYVQESGLVRVEFPEIDYHLDNGTARVRAQWGEVRQESGRARLGPDVSVVLDEATVLADELDYDAANQLLVLSGNVKVSKPGADLTAPRLEIRLDWETAEATGGVRVEFSGSGTLATVKIEG